MTHDDEEWQALWGAWCASWRRSPDEVIDVDAAYRQFSRRHGGAGVYAARERRTRRDLKRLERRCRRRLRRLHGIEPQVHRRAARWRRRLRRIDRSWAEAWWDQANWPSRRVAK